MWSSISSFQGHLDYIFRHFSLLFPKSLKHTCVRGNERHAFYWERALTSVHVEREIMSCELLFLDVKQRNAFFFFALVQRLCLFRNPTVMTHCVISL